MLWPRMGHVDPGRQTRGPTVLAATATTCWADSRESPAQIATMISFQIPAHRPSQRGPFDPFNNCTACHGPMIWTGGFAGVSCYDCHGDLWSGGENLPPVSDPNGPYTGTVGVAVTFDGSGSSDPDGTIVSYDWDFGDGSTGTGVNPTHTYAADGFYTVTLVVTDDGTLTDSQSTTADISEQGGNLPPVIDSGAPLLRSSGRTDPIRRLGNVRPRWRSADLSVELGRNPTHVPGHRRDNYAHLRKRWYLRSNIEC